MVNADVSAASNDEGGPRQGTYSEFFENVASNRGEMKVCPATDVKVGRKQEKSAIENGKGRDTVLHCGEQCAAERGRRNNMCGEALIGF